MEINLTGTLVELERSATFINRAFTVLSVIGPYQEWFNQNPNQWKQQFTVALTPPGLEAHQLPQPKPGDVVLGGQTKPKPNPQPSVDRVIEREPMGLGDRDSEYYGM